MKVYSLSTSALGTKLLYSGLLCLGLCSSNATCSDSDDEKDSADRYQKPRDYFNVGRFASVANQDECADRHPWGKYLSEHEKEYKEAFQEALRHFDTLIDQADTPFVLGGDELPSKINSPTKTATSLCRMYIQDLRNLNLPQWLNDAGCFMTKKRFMPDAEEKNILDGPSYVLQMNTATYFFYGEEHVFYGEEAVGKAKQLQQCFNDHRDVQPQLKRLIQTYKNVLQKKDEDILSLSADYSITCYYYTPSTSGRDHLKTLSRSYALLEQDLHKLIAYQGIFDHITTMIIYRKYHPSAKQ